MPTFQFKDPKYVLSPPQSGTKSIVNDLTNDDSYKQVIDNLPVTSSTNLDSIDFRSLAIVCLLMSTGSNHGLSAGLVRLLDHEIEGRKILDLDGDGRLSAADALLWLKFAQSTTNTRPLDQKQHAGKVAKYLEEYYEEYKNESVTYYGAVYKIYVSEPVNNTGEFDIHRHYIVADASERFDKLKLVKYNSKPNFLHSYWFDAGTGSETEGLDATGFTGSKTANSSKIVGKKLEFDGSDSTVVNVSDNSINITNHGFVTGDEVELSLIHI